MELRSFDLDVALVLPGVVDTADSCVARLIEQLSAKDGVGKVEVHVNTKDGRALLSVQYDPAVLSLSRIKELVSSAGAHLSSRFGHLFAQAEGTSHARKAKFLVQRIEREPGVMEARASGSGLVSIEFDRHIVTERVLSERLASMGVSVKREASASGTPVDSLSGAAAPAIEEGGHAHEHGTMLGPNTEMLFAILCGAFLGAGFAIEKLLGSGPSWLPLVLFVASYFFGGFYTTREAIDNLRHRRFEIDTLMLVAAAGAAVLGSWEEGALLLFLFSLGHALEHYAMGRAKRAIEALSELTPEVARVRREGSTVEIPLAQLRVGDTVLVLPNERLAADGFVVKGVTSIDQAPVTGESIPVDKRPVEDAGLARLHPDRVEPSSRVFAGTINGSGAIEIETTKAASDSAMARVVRLVSDAQTRQSPTQRFTDKFERIFVPSVLGLTTLLMFAWVIVDEPSRDSFYRAMAVLVAASPCALAIATPSAVLSGIARAARSGVLVKGGAPLETLGMVDAIAFDKTGTLTEGKPRITDVMPLAGVRQDELLAVAVAVESLSDHPLATAIARDGKAILGSARMLEAFDIESLTGRGIKARIEGEIVWIGKAEMFGSDGVPALSPAARAAIEALRESGRTTMFVRRGDRDLGAIGLLDTPRPSAGQTLEKLRQLGIRRMVMISGDHQRVATAIAAQVGLDEARGDLMPEDKVTTIQQLRSEAPVAMVGDGVNDAPAMANASVGIAMGAAGSDVALEAADVALMADDLSKLTFAVGLSRQARSVIRQNVFVSLTIVAILIPSTILGLGIGAAVAVHEGSTLLVVFNALRLLSYKEPT